MKMKREMIIKHMNDAISLNAAMKNDKNLRLVYYDVDLESFIDRCREILAEQWEHVDNLEIPFSM